MGPTTCSDVFDSIWDVGLVRGQGCTGVLSAPVLLAHTCVLAPLGATCLAFGGVWVYMVCGVYGGVGKCVEGQKMAAACWLVGRFASFWGIWPCTCSFAGVCGLCRPLDGRGVAVCVGVTLMVVWCRWCIFVDSLVFFVFLLT